MGMLLSACPQAQEVTTIGTTDYSSSEIVVAEEYVKSDSAAFLAANHAWMNNDAARAADEFSYALSYNPNNIELMKLSFQTYYFSGNLDAAATIASQIEQQGEQVTFGSEPALIFAINDRDWVGMKVLSDKLLEDAVSRPLGIVMGAWALALQNQGDSGLTQLLELSTSIEDEVPSALFSQSALINEYLGNANDALASADLAIAHKSANISMVINMAGLMARLGKIDQAMALLDERLGQFFDREMIINGLKDGTSPMLIKPSVDHILSEAIIEASGVRPTNANDNLSVNMMARLHLARAVSRLNDRITYLISSAYRDLGDEARAKAFHQLIKPNSPWSMPSHFLNARHLSRTLKDHEQSKLLFDELINRGAPNASILKQAGDAAGRREDYASAIAFYDEAIRLMPTNARLHYHRGVSLDKLKLKKETEEAFRASIALNPNDAYALNYLGYWLLEEGGDAEEALGFIRTAIKQQPRNGYFMDSLGWGHFKLNQYKQAILYLERAVMLKPVDPLITDHLGDAYFEMGRVREAVFQWRRALDLNPDPEAIPTITDKINKWAAE